MPALTPMTELLRTYAFAYTAMHDFRASDRIMTADYVLHMGPLAIRGRGEEYQPATQRQYDQFPGLGFTVHRLVSNGERAALHFSEHGRSVYVDAEAAWQGVSLYRWNHERLTECRVEQDYYSRRQQLASGQPLQVLPPGRDPWTGVERPASSSAEDRALEWLASPDWRTAPGVRHDDGTERPVIADQATEVLDLFSAGTTVAFHVRVAGTYGGGLGSDEDLVGRQAALYVGGLIDVHPAGEISGVVVTDRLSMLRRMRNRA